MFFSNPEEVFRGYRIFETGVNCVFSSPTGSGKTHASMKRLVELYENEGGIYIYTVPLRSLAIELYEKWKKENSCIGLNIGGLKQGKKWGKSGIFIMTWEKLFAYLLNWKRFYNLLSKIRVCIFDEIHMIDNDLRGGTLETCILFLRIINPFTSVIAMSATLGRERKLTSWLHAVRIVHSLRTVPLEVNFIQTDEEDKYQSVVKIIESSTLVFVNSRKKSENIASQLRKDGINALCHHAGLGYEVRGKVEEEFKNKTTDVLVCTPTLESGLNLPVKQVIIYDISTNGKKTDYRALHQKCGRAGRMNFDDKGRSIILYTPRENSVKHRFNAPFEDLVSRLDVTRFTLSVIYAGLGRRINEIKRVYEKSYSMQSGIDVDIEKILFDLKKHDLITQKDGRYYICDLGAFVLRLNVNPYVFSGICHSLISNPFTPFDLLVLSCGFVSETKNLNLSFPIKFNFSDDIRSMMGDELSKNTLYLKGILCLNFIFGEYSDIYSKDDIKHTLSTVRSVTRMIFNYLKTKISIPEKTLNCAYYMAEGFSLRDSLVISSGTVSLRKFRKFTEAEKESQWEILKSTDSIYEEIFLSGKLFQNYKSVKILDGYDTARIIRSMNLTVRKIGNGEYEISGGQDNHVVTENSCDCMDFSSGNICKHIIALRTGIDTE
ncbi:MAG: DEAD/DEAH box helicase [Deltaproteobacteria bacterium]|nr:DEAD/DEAH box helicase [Deltaproteobacteria bacterium]